MPTMNTHKSTFSIISVLASFAIFVLGAILGAVLEKQYDNWVLSNIIDYQLYVLATILIFLVLTISLLLITFNLMRHLYDKIGIKVRYVDVEASGEVYRSFSNVIRKATKSIFVVNSHLVEGDMSNKGTPQSREARDMYYGLLLEKAHKVKYVRIVQVSPDGSTLNNLKIYNRALFTHFKNMLEQKESNSNIYLLKSPPVRVTTFVLVDKQHLIWQINEVDFDSDGHGKLNLHGAFIIHDPMTRITSHFIDYFNKLESLSKAHIQYDSQKDELI